MTPWRRKEGGEVVMGVVRRWADPDAFVGPGVFDCVHLRDVESGTVGIRNMKTDVVAV